MEQVKKSVFETLNAVNCNEHTERKGQLTYLSWAWAWAEVKKRFPNAFYTIYEDVVGRPYFDDGRTCWVKTGVTIEGLEHIEYLPIMDARNNSLPLERVTSFDMNKSIQRSLTKACARHGLGLYIYAGEDLPEGEEVKEEKDTAKKPVQKAAEPKASKPAAKAKPVVNEDDDELIAKIAAWVLQDQIKRRERADEGYDWRGDAYKKFFAIINEHNRKELQGED